MTINDLLDQSITLDGEITIHKWIDDDYVVVLEEGFEYEIPDEVRDLEITFIYAQNNVLMIDVREEEE